MPYNKRKKLFTADFFIFLGDTSTVIICLYAFSKGHEKKINYFINGAE